MTVAPDPDATRAPLRLAPDPAPPPPLRPAAQAPQGAPPGPHAEQQHLLTVAQRNAAEIATDAAVRRYGAFRYAHPDEALRLRSDSSGEIRISEERMFSLWLLDALDAVVHRGMLRSVRSLAADPDYPATERAIRASRRCLAALDHTLRKLPKSQYEWIALTPAVLRKNELSTGPTAMQPSSSTRPTAIPTAVPTAVNALNRENTRTESTLNNTTTLSSGGVVVAHAHAHAREPVPDESSADVPAAADQLANLRTLRNTLAAADTSLATPRRSARRSAAFAATETTHNKSATEHNSPLPLTDSPLLLDAQNAENPEHDSAVDCAAF